MLVRPGFEPTASLSADRRLSKIELTGRRQTDKLTKGVSTLEPCAHFSTRVHCLDLVIGHWHRVRSLSRVLKKGCDHMRGRAGSFPGPDGVVLHCLPYFPHHIPFNCSDTALGVAESMIGARVIILVFRYAHFVSRIWRQNSSPGSLAVTYLGSRAEISHMKPRRNSSR